jgi:hypothetical protein
MIPTSSANLRIDPPLFVVLALTERGTRSVKPNGPAVRVPLPIREPGDSAALMPSSGILTQLHDHRSRTRRSGLGDGLPPTWSPRPGPRRQTPRSPGWSASSRWMETETPVRPRGQRPAQAPSSAVAVSPAKSASGPTPVTPRVHCVRRSDPTELLHANDQRSQSSTQLLGQEMHV